MKANVQISAVKREFKNGQQGWQVYVQGMEGKLNCAMNFKDALKAMRYSFLLAKKLELQINEIQLAALSLEYQRAKSAAQKAQIAEQAQSTAADVQQTDNHGASSEDESEEAPEEPAQDAYTHFCNIKKNHPNALILFRSGEKYECYDEDAIKAAEVLALTDIKEVNGFTVADFQANMLDSFLPKLIRAGVRVAICDALDMN
ncbi:MAG: hypothetical protein K6E52_00695 [Bacteroidaceae bacterium]|nr:hypothetical protein [Bacteroidaceae bacterium]